MGLLAGRTAVVTGGSSGIGRSISMRFAEEGADIVVADIRPSPRDVGRPTHEKINESTERDSTFVECDVSKTGELTAAVTAAENFGGIDIMVNNAGIIRDTPVFDVSVSEFDRFMDVNAKGVFFGSKIAAAQMIQAESSGSIINLSSVLGIRGSGSFVPYVASKGAVRLMTYALADAFGPHRIRVNAIHPGTVETSMNTDDLDILGGEGEDRIRDGLPLGRLGRPREIADAAVFLASEMASYVTGTSLVVDGGEANTSY